MTTKTTPKDQRAVELGRKGGAARWAKLTAKQRSALASRLARAYWEKYRREHPTR